MYILASRTLVRTIHVHSYGLAIVSTLSTLALLQVCRNDRQKNLSREEAALPWANNSIANATRTASR